MNFQLLSFAQVAAVFTAEGEEPVKVKSVERWISRGVTVKGYPQRVKLNATQIPGGRRVRAEDLAEFIEALQTANQHGAGQRRSERRCGAAGGSTVRHGSRRKSGGGGVGAADAMVARSSRGAGLPVVDSSLIGLPPSATRMVKGRVVAITDDLVGHGRPG